MLDLMRCGVEQKPVTPTLKRPAPLQVQAQLRKGNADMAKATLEKEKLLMELRNQIAIIR